MRSDCNIKGIIFDMDGVLCDSEPFICEAACLMFKEKYGISVVPEDFKPFVGAGEDKYLGGVAEKYGIKLVLPSDKELTYSIYLRIIKGRLKPFAGVKQFIGKCLEARIKMAIATSADLIKLEGNLAELLLSKDNFDALITGSDVARKKPFPDIFLAAANKMGVAPPVALVIEDAPNGIKAAKAAQMRALGITSSFTARELMEAGADFIAKDLVDFQKVFFKEEYKK
jgi:HAD superfamily hydrolase (TIGR01509 family)